MNKIKIAILLIIALISSGCSPLSNKLYYELNTINDINTTLKLFNIDSYFNDIMDDGNGSIEWPEASEFDRNWYLLESENKPILIHWASASQISQGLIATYSDLLNAIYTEKNVVAGGKLKDTTINIHYIGQIKPNMSSDIAAYLGLQGKQSFYVDYLEEGMPLKIKLLDIDWICTKKEFEGNNNE